MTGIEKIVSRILEEANSLAQKTIDEANAKARAITDEARTEADKTANAIDERSKVDVANQKERIVSAADTQAKKALLEAKQELITQAIEKAYQEFLNQGDASYFDAIIKLVEQYAEPDKGEIYFNAKDKARINPQVEGRIKDAAKNAKGELTFASESRDIEGGFVLVYGGVEINCSIRAIFDAKQSELQDLVQKNLFAQPKKLGGYTNGE